MEVTSVAWSYGDLGKVSERWTEEIAPFDCLGRRAALHAPCSENEWQNMFPALYSHVHTATLQLATASDDGTVRLWSVDRHRKGSMAEGGHRPHHSAVRFKGMPLAHVSVTEGLPVGSGGALLCLDTPVDNIASLLTKIFFVQGPWGKRRVHQWCRCRHTCRPRPSALQTQPQRRPAALLRPSAY